MADQAPERPAWRLEPGQRVDHFRVIRPIGRGGMGEVYAAQDERLGRRVALKLLGTVESESKALAEARATAQFSHPHIVTLHEVGTHEGSAYLALEFLEGGTLKARIREGPMPVIDALRVGRDVALAVQEAHAHGVHHRDLKPGNVFLAQDGRLRVLDFGLAELASEARDVRGRGLRGTPAYMAPEQWRREPTGPEADIWALGLMLFEAISGEHPAPRRDMSGYQRWAMNPALPVLEDVPEVAVALIRACLRRDRGGRPKAGELVAQLGGLVEAGALDAREPSPFKGLLAFSEGDAARFRGREAEIATFVERLRDTPTLAILGPSGAGKSSFVRAGVIPRLRAFAPLAVVELRPGRRPLAALMEALDRAETATIASATESLESADPSLSAEADRLGHDGLQPLEPVSSIDGQERPELVAARLHQLADRRGARVLLFVDQLEELVVLAESPDERRAFMAVLASAAEDPARPVRAVFTLREEFSSRVVNAAESSAALTQVVVLRDPGPEELRRVLLEPLAAVGYAFDDAAVVDEMIAEVRGRPSSLPLLQFAAARLWEVRDRVGKKLLRAEYDAMGGVAGALAHRADEILSALGADEMVIGRALWLRLVTPERTRRSVPREELVDGLGEVGTALLLRFMEARLVVSRRTAGEDVEELEMAHEALIERWARLAGWIAQSSEELLILAELERVSARWERHGRRDGDLWSGDALRDAERALAGYLGEVPERALRFLNASAARERRARWRARATIALVISALAVAAAVFATGQRTAEQQRRRAEEQRAQAELEGARLALAQGRPLEARAKLRNSLESADSVGGRWLWRSLLSETREWRQDTPSYYFLSDFGPDDAHIVVSSPRALLVLDANTKSRRHVLPVDNAARRGVGFSRDGRWLAASFRLGELRVWDLEASPPVEISLKPRGGPGPRIRWSEDGELIVLTEGTLESWRPGDPQLRLRDTFSDGDGKAFAFGASLRPLVRTSGRTLLVHREVGAEAEGLVLDSPVHSVDVHPTQPKVVVGLDNGHVEVWDLSTRKRTWRGRGHARPLRHVRFDPTGRRFVSVSLDGVVLWRLGQDAAERSFDCAERSYSASFGRAGDRLAVVCREGSLRVHRLELPPLDEVIEGHGTETMGPSVDPKGVRAASGGADFTARLWQLADGRPATPPLPHRSSVWETRFSPDGQVLATGQQNGDVVLWDVLSGRAVRTLAGLGAGVNWIEFTHDGRAVRAGDTQGETRSWTLQPGAEAPAPPPCKSVVRLSAGTQRRYAVTCDVPSSVLVIDDEGSVHHRWRPSSPPQLIEWTGPEELAFDDEKGQHWSWSLEHPAPRRVDALDALDALDESTSLISAHPASGLAAYGGRDRLDVLGSSVPVRLPGHAVFTNMGAFGPRGELLATTGGDGALRVWRIAHGRKAWRLGGLGSGGQALLRGPEGWLDLSVVPAAPYSFPSPTPGWIENPTRGNVPVGVDDLWCLRGGEELRMFSFTTGQERHWPGARPDQVWPQAGSCLVANSDGLVRYPFNGAPQRIHAGAVHVIEGRHRLWRIEDTQVLPLEEEHPSVPVDGSVVAATQVGTWLVVAYADGRLSFLDIDTGESRANFELESLGLAELARLTAGPDETLIAGFLDGGVAVWDTTTGALLLSAQLNGRIEHVEVSGSVLFAATDLGAFGRWGLSPVLREHCELLREVWAQVPVVWETEAPVVRPPPPHHACLSR